MLVFGERYVGSFPETYSDAGGGGGVGQCFHACTGVDLEKPCIIKGVGNVCFLHTSGIKCCLGQHASKTGTLFTIKAKIIINVVKDNIHNPPQKGICIRTTFP